MKKHLLLAGGVFAAFLPGCESRQPPAASEKPPAQPVAAAVPVRAPVAVLPDTVDYTRTRLTFQSRPIDTLIRIGTRRCHLLVQTQTDSTKPIDYRPAAVVGTAFAPPGDTARPGQVRGYAGTYTFTLRDSANRVTLFRQRLHKPDFYPVAAREVVVVSEPDIQYLGYSPALQALAFVVYLGIPASDVADRATLLLDVRTGKVTALRTSGSATFGASDCDPQVSPSGKAVLTCGELLRANQPAIRLEKPHATLVAARFLTDSSLLAVYEYGEYKRLKRANTNEATNDQHPSSVLASPVPGAKESAPFTATDDYEFVATPAQRRAPNAFILNTEGKTLKSFWYPDWSQEMSYYLPRHFVADNRTYYFLNGEQSVFLIPKSDPAAVVELPLKQLPKFRGPRLANEVKFTLSTTGTQFDFYVSKNNPQQVRYHRQTGGE